MAIANCFPLQANAKYVKVFQMSCQHFHLILTQLNSGSDVISVGREYDGAYSKLKIFGAALKGGRHFFEGDVYSKSNSFWHENLVFYF